MINGWGIITALNAAQDRLSIISKRDATTRQGITRTALRKSGIISLGLGGLIGDGLNENIGTSGTTLAPMFYRTNVLVS